MVKVRLSRGGSKKRPFYHIVATNSRSSRDGKYIERLGFYNPDATGQDEDIKIDQERLTYWESVGAQVSDRVQNIIKLNKLSREERDSQRQVKLANKKSKRDELKLKQREAAEEEAPAEEAKAETEAEPEAAEEEAPAEEAKAETEADPEAAEEEETKKDKDDSA